MSGLYRFECEYCGNIRTDDSFDLVECQECEAEGAVLAHKPSLDHDREIMEAPPSGFACPNCGEKKFAEVVSEGRHHYWICELSGGCGFSKWSEADGEIRMPADWDWRERGRFKAWCRVQQYEAGEFEY